MKKTFLFFLISIILLPVSACEVITETLFGKDESSEEHKNINIIFYLTDKPLESIQNLSIIIDKAVCSLENGSEVTINISKEINVVDLVQNEIKLFEIKDIEEGTNISWLQIYISPVATITIDNIQATLIVQPAKKIYINSAVSDGDSFIIDFDLPSSIKEIGHSEKYTLIPTFHIWKKGDTSSLYNIEGKIKDSGSYVDGKTLFLLPSDESTILKSTISKNGGRFKFGGVEDGDYVIAAFTNFEIPQDDASLLDLIAASDASTFVELNGENRVNLEITLP